MVALASSEFMDALQKKHDKVNTSVLPHGYIKMPSGIAKDGKYYILKGLCAQLLEMCHNDQGHYSSSKTRKEILRHFI